MLVLCTFYLKVTYGCIFAWEDASEECRREESARTAVALEAMLTFKPGFGGIAGLAGGPVKNY